MATQSNFEVFGFNTSKNPEKHSEELLSDHVVSINHFATESKSTPFIDSLLEVLKPKTIDSLNSTKLIIEEFRMNANYISSTEILNREYNNILILHSTLSSLNEMNIEIRETTLHTLQIGSYDELLSFSNKWDILWDNLISEIISPKDIELRRAYINAIKTFKIAKYILRNQITSIRVLKNLLKNIPVIPNGILPLPKKNNQPVLNNTNAGNSIENYNDILSEISNIKTAIDDLKTLESKYKRLAHENQKNLKVDIDSEGHVITSSSDTFTSIDFINLNSERFNELTSENQDTLNKYSLNVDMGITFQNAIIKLTSKLASLNEELYKPKYASKKGIIEGGVLFGIDDWQSYPADLGDIITPLDFPNWLEPMGAPCRVKPIGISDYRKVEANWKRYEAGEIAHIENLLKGEYKDRETRHLRSTEETYTLETVKESEVIRDLQTTERFALQKEASKIVQQDFNAKVDAYVKGNYGTVSFGVSGGVSFNQSSSTSKAEASQYAKDVIDRSINRILERTREERTVKILEEFEEKNVHKLDNIAGQGHIVGVYRWVDKIMQCKLANYGKRLLFEFMVPEPAAFHIFAKTRKSIKGVYVEKPNHPNMGINNPITNTTITLNCPENLDETNYKIWAGAYGANVEPYPQNMNIAKAFKDTVPNAGGWIHTAQAENSLKLPDGYQSFAASISYAHENGNGHSFAVSVAEETIDSWNIWVNTPNGYITLVIDNIVDTIPVSWINNNSYAITFNIEIKCEPTPTKISEWKLKTYQAILDAYNKKMDDYNNAVSEAQVSQGITIEGNNPLINREIEKNELKKSCIQLMTANDFYNQFDAMFHPDENLPLPDSHPYFDNCEAIKEGHIVKFIESILDWDIMSYFFHPYFWTKRNRWVEIYNTSSIDPLHTSFLQAGFARVVVPVKPGFENIAMQFVETGQYSYDTSAIALSSQEALDAIAELSENDFKDNIPDPVLDPTGYALWQSSDLNPANWPTWEVRLPTNLVILQDSCPVNSDQALPINPNI